MTSSQMNGCLCSWQYAFHRFSLNRRQILGTVAAVKYSFHSDCRFTIFTNKIIRSDTLSLYIANTGIQLMFLLLASHNNENRRFRSRGKFSQNFATCHRKTFLSALFQNADSRFLMNTIISSILIWFTNCKHRHQYIGIIQIFEQCEFLIFSKSRWPPDASRMKYDS